MLLQMIVMLAVGSTMWASLNLYVGTRLLAAAPPPLHAPLIAALAVSVLVVPATMALLRARTGPALNAFQWLGYTIMGLVVVVFFGVGAVDLLLLLAGAVERVAQRAALPLALPAAEAWRGPLTAAVGVGAVGLTALGLRNALQPARVERVRVPVAGLPEALEGLRIVQISDLHVGPTVRRGLVQEIVDRVNALEPDLIAVTGDLVDGTVAGLADQVAPLAGLRAPLGRWFVTGNHEYYSDALPWCAHVEEALGMTVLHDEHRVLEHNGATLVVAGVPDRTARGFVPQHRSDPAAAIAGAPPAGLRLLLAHQPRSAPAAAAAGFDLMLCGHTHGGQFAPMTWLIHLAQPFVAGLGRLDDLHVYTHRGTTWWGPPLRVGAPHEIAVIELARA